jgi:aminoglycoside phosphotransferase (APT) family kinase protein
VPASLVHGDLHLDNVARPEGRFVFFDWTDACLAHPFLDLIDILGERDAATRELLQKQYLDEWLEYESPGRLREMWALAAPLSAAHQAVSYQHLIEGAEESEKPHLSWAMPEWLPKILEEPASH